MKRVFAFVLLLAVSAAASSSQTRLSIGVYGGIHTSLEPYDGGGSIGGMLLYDLSEHVQLTLSSAYMSWSDRFAGSFRAIPILFGARVLAGRGDVIPYGMLDVGLYSMSMRRREDDLISLAIAPVTMPWGEQSVYPVGQYRSMRHMFGVAANTSIGYSIGLGVVLKVSEQFALEAGVKIHSIEDTRMHPEPIGAVVPISPAPSRQYFTAMTIGVLVRL